MDKRIHRLSRILLIGIILSLGFILRSHNLNFPAIGYHNMEENGYLAITEEMNQAAGVTAGKGYFYNGFDEKPASPARILSPPLLSYQILASRKVFGDNIWGVRLLNILFGLFSIGAIYYISLLLFNNVVPSLWCAFLLSTMPLSVFFSRNIQPESPAFFFMLLGNIFYLKFALSLKKYHLLLGSGFFCVALLYRFSFFIGVFAPLYCFPIAGLYKNKKDFFRSLLILCIPFLAASLCLVWLKPPALWLEELSALQGKSIGEMLTYDYWSKYARTIWWYIQGENFTLPYTLLALVGIMFAFLKRGGILERYLMAWAAALIPYGMLFSDSITQRNYAQFPFLALVCISVVYGIWRILEVTKFRDVLRRQYAFIPLAIIISAVSVPFASDSISRMRGTFFLGLDVAGASLREFTKQDERIFLLTHPQGQGIARYARRYTGWRDDFDDFKDIEKRLKVRYICFYPAEFALALKTKNPPLFEYIQNNYHVKEAGLTDEPNQLYYLILEKGEGSDPKDFLQSFSGPRQLKAIYKVLGRYIFFYALRPSRIE